MACFGPSSKAVRRGVSRMFNVLLKQKADGRRNGLVPGSSDRIKTKT
jgi:hypothetical protein